jgi:hypothetical protein
MLVDRSDPDVAGTLVSGTRDNLVSSPPRQQSVDSGLADSAVSNASPSSAGMQAYRRRERKSIGVSFLTFLPEMFCVNCA